MAELQRMIKESEELQTRHERVIEAVKSGKISYKEAKGKLLPWIMVGGVFEKPCGNGLLLPSCMFTLDVDNVPEEKVWELKTRLFEDEVLMPDLVFTSPSGRGVKAFVSYKMPRGDISMEHKEIVRAHMDYYDEKYGKDFGLCDRSGCDITRRCYLCHDADALYREIDGSVEIQWG